MVFQLTCICYVKLAQETFHLIKQDIRWYS